VALRLDVSGSGSLDEKYPGRSAPLLAGQWLEDEDEDECDPPRASRLRRFPPQRHVMSVHANWLCSRCTSTCRGVDRRLSQTLSLLLALQPQFGGLCCLALYSDKCWYSVQVLLYRCSQCSLRHEYGVSVEGALVHGSGI
jgi:hypothetical protein